MLKTQGIDPYGSGSVYTVSRVGSRWVAGTFAAVDTDGLTGAATSFSDLERSPRSLGYDAPTWTASVARRHLSSAYGVEYSTRHVRRLLVLGAPQE